MAQGITHSCGYRDVDYAEMAWHLDLVSNDHYLHAESSRSWPERNLYSGSLGLVNTIDVLTGRKINRVWVTLAVDIIGSVLSAVGILNYFTDLLTFLGCSCRRSRGS